MSESVEESFSVRPAREDDYEAVVDFTTDTWPDRDGGDYIPHIYHEWIADDGDGQQTFVVDVAGSDDVAGILQSVMLSEHEAWMQGMRVNPDYRGQGLSTFLQDAAFDWAVEQGATVARNMVFSWNVAGLGGSRASGFDPCTEFRWAHPKPDADADPSLRVTDDADGAWSFWSSSAVRGELKGLVLDDEETWAVSELTRGRLRAAAADDRLFVVQESGTRGLSYRVRSYDRSNEDGDVATWAEYAIGAWKPGDLEALRSLLAAVARDAAAVDADRTRVLIPEGVEWVSDVAYARTPVSDEPDFVMAADLTARR